MLKKEIQPTKFETKSERESDQANLYDYLHLPPTASLNEIKLLLDITIAKLDKQANVTPLIDVPELQQKIIFLKSIKLTLLDISKKADYDLANNLVNFDNLPQGEKMQAIAELKDGFELIPGTENFIAIKFIADKFNPHWIYYLANKEKQKISHNYENLFPIDEYFLAAKINGRYIFIDKNTGQELTAPNTDYVNIQVIGNKKVIAQRNDGWHWICTNEQQYRMPLGQEMTDGFFNISANPNDTLYGYTNNLASSGILLKPYSLINEKKLAA